MVACLCVVVVLSQTAAPKPRQSCRSPIPRSESPEVQRSVGLYVANPLATSESSYTSPLSASFPFNIATTTGQPLTPIPEASEFSLRSSFASTAATGPADSSFGSIPRSVSRRIPATSPSTLLPENTSLDQLLSESLMKGSGGPTSPSSFGSSSLNEFLRLEEQESFTDDLERQLMEGQEGDRSLVESVVGGMRNVEEAETETMSLSRSLGPSIVLGTDSMASMMSSSSAVDIAAPSRSEAGMGGSS